ncbi:MAG: ATP phosphoribosyltransferase regulatory subunit [Rhodocyclaceae bacterium]|nr:ATP phosphoribosyltransferase regulatory subunit [Rhodocyclaceae bacterium]
MHAWLLPEAVEDLLPEEARRIEMLRRRLLDECERWGYRLVMPPLIEFVESLLGEADDDLDLATFKLVDQISGRTLALRADITPQVARIDAHLLNRQGVARLCYCGSVVRTRPADLFSTREPLQLGAELYGHAGLEADHEIIRLLARILELAGISSPLLDIGHVGIFRALTGGLALTHEIEEALYAALQAKDRPALAELTQDFPEPARTGLRMLPDFYGGAEVIRGAAACLPALPEIHRALGDLQRLAGELADLSLSFDLADLRGYHYHNGVVFAAYAGANAGPVALGGRYDGAAARFGRVRAATGFSLDLRLLARRFEAKEKAMAILAPWPEDEGLRKRIEALRAEGNIVLVALPGDVACRADCDRRLVRRGEEWIIEPFEGD